MPIFFQQQINESTRLGIWKIEEPESFFINNVPLHREVTHPHKRLQHLAGRFLLQYLFPEFPYELIQIADTRKPFLPDETFHFSISHSGDYAAVIVSRNLRVGIDVEVPHEKISKIAYKFISAKEHELFQLVPVTKEHLPMTTLIWSAKEAVFKWYGNGGVDFRKDIQLLSLNEELEQFACFFSRTATPLTIFYKKFPSFTLTWTFN